MSTYICPQCGDAFDSSRDFRRHYVRTHPDEPYPEMSDEAARADDGGRSYGGSDPTDSDSPINVFEDVMEQSPDDTSAEVAAFSPASDTSESSSPGGGTTSPAPPAPMGDTVYDLEPVAEKSQPGQRAVGSNCTYCGADFDTQEALDRHLHEAHREHLEPRDQVA